MKKRWRWILVAVTMLFAIAALSWPVYVKPQLDELRRADAIFVLGGPDMERYTVGLAGALEGYASHVVMSNPIGEGSFWLTDLCTHQRYSFTVTCFQPQPPTTRGEARELRRLAESEGWHSVIVVTHMPHISRARYILERCFDGDLMMNDSEQALSIADWAWNYTYQTAGYVRAALQSGC